jgi:Questin oxidase-like
VSGLSAAVLSQLVLHGTQSPTLPNGLTNHAPMLAIALARLGAPDDVIVQRATHEGRNAKSFDAKSVETAPQVSSEHALDGLAGSGFHGLIRLAYGFDATHAGEIACGLAYLKKTALYLPANSNAPLITFSDWFSAICHAQHSPIEGDLLISELLQRAAKTSTFAQFHIHPESVPLAALAAEAMRLYIEQPSIDTLHGITACHALRVVLNAVGDRPSARLALGYALVALAIGVGRSASASASELPRKTPTVDELTALLPRVWTRDAHTVKFTYTCLEEYKIYGDPRYLAAAYARILK